MKTHDSIICRALWMAATLAASASAQIPDTLKHSIPPPPTGVIQAGSNFGQSVAANATYTVVGALLDDLGASNAGVAKVFDSATGVLLFTLANPSPAADDQFGHAVAISGTRVVVSAIDDDTGASNAGSVYVFDLSSANPFLPVLTLNNPAPAADDRFGISVAISGTRIAVGTPYDEASGSDAGTAYVYDLTSGTPAVPVLTIADPTPEAGDFFGNAMAMEGTRLAVAAFWDNTAGLGAGAVYVFDLAGGTPATPVVTLASPAPAASDGFGESVAISGTRVAVGATADDITWPNGGAVHVFDLSSGTPATPVFTIGTPTLGAFPGFGQSLALEGSRLVVGTPFDDTGATNSGTVIVYDLASGTPTVPALTIPNPTPANGDWFGYDVALAGNHLAIGARFDDTSAVDAGSAYFYNLGSGTPTVPVATLNNPSPAAGDLFGHAVAISGTWMVVGAPSDNTGASDTGSVSVYNLGGSTPTVPVAILNNPSPAAGDYFGVSVAISGTRVVVGAYQDDTGATDAGSAYVYDLSSGTPTVPVATLNNPSPAAIDLFGNAVAISGTRIVVGAYVDNTGADDAGSAYVYDLSSGTPTVPVAILNNPSPAANDYFGVSVAISGTRVMVGAFGDDTGDFNAGSVYVYDLSSGTPSVPVTTLNNPGPAGDDLFGSAVAISGTRMVVGAYGDDTGAFNAGIAYAYDLGGGTPTVPVATFNNPGPAVDDKFGFGVAISSTKVVVSAFGDDTGASNAGIAYVYDLGSGTPAVPVATLNNPSPTGGDQFGYSVAVSGITAVVGSPWDDGVAVDKGYGYAYEGSAAPVASALGDVISGALAPDGSGASDGTTFDLLTRGGYIAENGMLVFPGELTGPGVDGTNFKAFWKDDGSLLKRLVRTGEAAPETGSPGAVFSDLPLTPAINDDGQVTLLAALATTPLSSPPTTGDNDTGLWSELGGTGFQILMREDDDIPGLPAGTKIGRFEDGCYATARISPTEGEAAFTITMKGASTDTALLRASVVGPTVTAVGVVARENAPAGATGETFGFLNSDYTDATRMDAQGNIVFGAFLKPSYRTSLWYQPRGGALVTALVAGDPAPGTTGATFRSLDVPSMGGGGTFAFRAVLNLDGDNADNSRNDGIWRGSVAGGFACILRRGDDNTSRPGLNLPAGAKAGNIWSGWLTNANHGAWLGWVDLGGDGISPYPADTFGIYTDLSGTMSLLISSGDPAPGIAGANLFFVDHPVVGGVEQLAFIATVTGGGTTAGVNDKGLWRTGPGGGAPLLVLRTGTTMDTTQGSKTIADLDLPGSNLAGHQWETPVMDGTGRLVVQVIFTDGSSSQVLVP